MPWLHDRDSFILNDWILLRVVGRVKNYFYKESVIGGRNVWALLQNCTILQVFNSMDVL